MSTAFGGTGPASSSESFHYGGYNPQSSSQPQQLTPQRKPSYGAGVASTSSFMTSGELYASPSQPGTLSSMRPSSFREPSHARRSMSGGFGFSQYDVSSNQQTATPKNVRFEDASSFPFGNAQQQSSSQQQQQHQHQHQYQRLLGSSSIQQSNPSPYSQSQNASSNYSQPSYLQTSFQNSLPTQPSFTNSTQPSTNPLNMSDLQLTQQRQPSNTFTGSTWSAVSSSTINETNRPSAFTAPRLADLAKPIAVSSSPSRFTATTSSVVTQRPSIGQVSSSGTSIASQIKGIVITPRSAITARIRWNVATFLLAWLVQYVGPLNKAYWFALTTTFQVFGGDSDVHLASLLSWLRSAIFVLTFANVVEAVIRLQTGQSDAVKSSVVAPAAAVQKRKPSLAFPPNRTVSSSASDNVNAALQKHRSEPRHFAQNSPLRETIFRAGVSAQQRLASSSSSPLGGGLRIPSQTPSNYEGPNVSGTRLRSSSPAAAYLARRQEQRTVSGTTGLGQNGVGDRSFDPDVSGAADYSTDSIEVTRAIRALSASYGREMSEVRTAGPSTTARGSIVAA